MHWNGSSGSRQSGFHYRQSQVSALGAQRGWLAILAHRRTLEEKRRLLGKAIQAITDIEETLRTCNDVNAALFRRIIEVMALQNDREDWQAAYERLMQVWRVRRTRLSPKRWPSSAESGEL
jgi:hypothetical protein